MLPKPKARSKTWLSTCYALDTEDPAAAQCGPEYHVRPRPELEGSTPHCKAVA